MRNEKSITNTLKYYGVFATVTNYVCTALESLNNYRLRADIKRVFDSGKSDFATGSLKSHDLIPSEGRLFVLFISLCLLEVMQSELAKAKLTTTKKSGRIDSNTYTIDAVIEKMQSISYHKNLKTNEIFYVGVSEDQKELAKALDCEGIYDAPIAYV